MPANAQGGTTPAAKIMPQGVTLVKDEVGQDVQVSNGTISPDAIGSLTIFKRATKDTDNPLEPTGEAETRQVPGDKLEGAGFTLYKVTNADLTSNAGLAAASKLTVATAQQGDAVGPDRTLEDGTTTKEQLTDADGRAVWGTLPVGVYLLKETTTPQGFSPAEDALIFVPMTRNNAQDGGTQWLYDITAYPKNTKQTPEKRVKDSGQNIGGTVEYTIDTWAQKVDKTVIGKDAQGNDIQRQYRTIYRIEDELDPALDATNAKVAVTSDKREYVADTDYKVIKNGQKIVVEFTDAGVAKIENGEKISATITADLKELPVSLAGRGDLRNKARQIQNNPNSNQKTAENETPSDTPEVHTYYGGITFKKVNSDRTGLADAEFEVYGTNNDKCTNADKKAGKNENGFSYKQTVKNQSTWKSAADGKVTIEGLHVNNISDYDGSKANEFKHYCLFETKSPKGYELLAEPITFTLNASETKEDGKVTNVEIASDPKQITVGNNDGEVVNLEDSTPKLPLTGGMGIGILAALGALIIAAGAYSAKRRSA